MEKDFQHAHLASLALTFLSPPPMAFAGTGACKREIPATAVDPIILLKKERRDDSSCTIDNSVLELDTTALEEATGEKAPTEAHVSAKWRRQNLTILQVFDVSTNDTNSRVECNLYV